MKGVRSMFAHFVCEHFLPSNLSGVSHTQKPFMPSEKSSQRKTGQRAKRNELDAVECVSCFCESVGSQYTFSVAFNLNSGYLASSTQPNKL